MIRVKDPKVSLAFYQDVIPRLSVMIGSSVELVLIFTDPWNGSPLWYSLILQFDLV